MCRVLTKISNSATVILLSLLMSIDINSRLISFFDIGIFISLSGDDDNDDNDDDNHNDDNDDDGHLQCFSSSCNVIKPSPSVSTSWK